MFTQNGRRKKFIFIELGFSMTSRDASNAHARSCTIRDVSLTSRHRRMNFDFLPDSLSQHLPTQPWAQLIVGLFALFVIAEFVQWVIARVLLRIAHRLLVLAGHAAWDRAFI